MLRIERILVGGWVPLCVCESVWDGADLLVAQSYKKEDVDAGRERVFTLLFTLPLMLAWELTL